MFSEELDSAESESYDRQINALVGGIAAERQGETAGANASLDMFCQAADVPPDIQESMKNALSVGGTLIKTVWAETGGCPLSLFAFLPGCQHCLTQAKSAYGMGAESDWYVEQLGIIDNPNVPSTPDQISVELLPEFARLQTRARMLARS